MEGSTVLVVEDDAQIRSALVAKFTTAGLTAVEAVNGQEGLDIAVRDHPALIVLDIMMPIMNGLDMARELRKDPWGKTARVMILTNLKTEMKAVQEIFGGEAPPYLIKASTSLSNVVDQAQLLLQDGP